MLTMSTYETKARLSELLGLVALGMTIQITKNRVPVARLVPINPQEQEKLTESAK